MSGELSWETHVERDTLTETGGVPGAISGVCCVTDPLQIARVMLSKSCHLSLAGSMYPGSVLPAWLRSTLQTAACTSGTAAHTSGIAFMGQVGTSDVTLQSRFILPDGLDSEKDTEV